MRQSWLLVLLMQLLLKSGISHPPLLGVFGFEGDS